MTSDNQKRSKADVETKWKEVGNNVGKNKKWREDGNDKERHSMVSKNRMEE